MIQAKGRRVIEGNNKYMEILKRFQSEKQKFTDMCGWNTLTYCQCSFLYWNMTIVCKKPLNLKDVFELKLPKEEAQKWSDQAVASIKRYFPFVGLHENVKLAPSFSARLHIHVRGILTHTLLSLCAGLSDESFNAYFAFGTRSSEEYNISYTLTHALRKFTVCLWIDAWRFSAGDLWSLLQNDTEHPLCLRWSKLGVPKIFDTSGSGLR